MNLLGTRLTCETCGAQAVVIHDGDGTLECHGVAMVVVAGSGDVASQEARRASSKGSGGDDVEYFESRDR